MYTIGQLSKRTGVTIRTLDYYDEIGLIKPSSATDGGHRLYEEDAVLRLEQVLSLKYMGFSLKKIREVLNDSKVTWEQSIEQQLAMVNQQKKRLQALEQALEGVLYSIRFEGGVKWPVIFEIIHLFQQDTDAVNHLYETYLLEDEKTKLLNSKAFKSVANIREWSEIIHAIREHLGEEPASEAAQRLAKRWMNQVYAMYGRDEALLERLWDMIKAQQDGIAFYPMSADVIQFIDRAITIMHEREEQNDK